MDRYDRCKKWHILASNSIKREEWKMETVSKCPTGTLFSQATELTSAFIDNSPRLARATREGARGKSHLHQDDKHYFSFRNRWQFWGVMHSLWFLLRIYSTTVINLYIMCFCFLGHLSDMDMDGGYNSSSTGLVARSRAWQLPITRNRRNIASANFSQI